MFARVTTIQGPPESVEDSIIAMREKALPQARQLAGFKGLIALTDRESGKGLTITLWKDEAALKASAEAAKKIRSETVGAITGSEIMSVQAYEVTLDER